jgi:UDP-N-acetylmuramoyl-tripeptide--D-alanyl-D-alanine ligase
VGELGVLISDEARRQGMPEKQIYHCATNQEAIQVLTDILQAGDMILVKGSRGQKMEEIVAALGEG